MGAYKTSESPDDFDPAELVQDCQNMNTNYGNINFFLVGDDFKYQNAENIFKFLDFALSKNPNVHYLTIPEFSKHFEKEVDVSELPIFKDDFFPYVEPSSGDIWTGYFTTKPRLKIKIREIGKAIRTLENLVGIHFAKFSAQKRNEITNNLFDISEDFGYFLHHDTITGTSVNDVNKDTYLKFDLIKTKIRTLYSILYQTKINSDDFNEI